MALPTNPARSWLQRFDLPSTVFGEGPTGGTDYELYEEDGEFVLSVELPGFDPADIDVAWDDGILNVAADHADEDRARQRTYYQRFRFPKGVDEDAIEASYTNGVLEVRLPISEEAAVPGRSIPIEG